MTIRMLDFPIEITNRDEYPALNYSWHLGPDLAQYVQASDTAADVTSFFGVYYGSASAGNTGSLRILGFRKYQSGDNDISDQVGDGRKAFCVIPVKYVTGQLLFEWYVNRRNTAGGSLVHVYITGYTTNDSFISHDNKVMVNTSAMVDNWNAISADAATGVAAGVVAVVGNAATYRAGLRKYGESWDYTQHNYRSAWFMTQTDAQNRYEAWVALPGSTRVKEIGYFLSAAPIEWYDPPTAVSLSVTSVYADITLTAAVGAFLGIHHSATGSESATFDVF